MTIAAFDPEQGAVSIDVKLMPIDSQIPLNRVYPFYVRTTE